MKLINIVDDNQKDAEQLKKFVEQYAGDKNITVSVRIFKDGLDFLGAYKSNADVVFLDVEMPILNGIEVARKLRKIDSYVSIVFVTNMAQYALKGYEVAALDYVIKPITYYGTADRLRRAFSRSDQRESKYLIVNVSSCETVRLPVTDIDYIEKKSNYLFYYTTSGEYKSRGQIKDIEKDVEGMWFSKSISGCLVNLGHVEKTTQNSVFVGGKEITLARHRRKEFMNDLMTYLGQGGSKN